MIPPDAQPHPAATPALARQHPLEAMPFSLLDEPLEYIFADHFRQRTICSTLFRFAGDGGASRTEADMVTSFLVHDLPLHNADEEEDLFPAIRRRAMPEDDLGVVLARLSNDNHRCAIMIDGIVKALSAWPATGPVRISPRDGELMQAFATAERRHIAIENGVLLAIARIRLKRSDLREISCSMKARRGVVH